MVNKSGNSEASDEIQQSGLGSVSMDHNVKNSKSRSLTLIPETNNKTSDSGSSESVSKDMPISASSDEYSDTKKYKQGSEEFTDIKQNVHDLRRKSSAAISIQRRVRGMGARVSISKRRESAISENQFLKTLNPLQSPSENATNALLQLATVMFTLISNYLSRVLYHNFVAIVCCSLCCSFLTKVVSQRLNLSSFDIAVINYAVRTLQVQSRFHQIFEPFSTLCCILSSELRRG